MHRKAPERTALLFGTGAVSGFAGCGRRPSPSGFNTARQLPLRVNEWQLFYIIAIRVEPRVTRPLQIVARDFFVTIQQSSERAISQMEVLNSLENNKKENEMVNFKEDERLSTLNHSCAHVMAQAVKHLYPHAKFWVGPVVKEGFYYDIDLGNDVVNDEVIAAIEKR